MVRKTCEYCGATFEVSSEASYLENPFCTGCYEQRVEEAIKAMPPGEYKLEGDYLEWVSLETTEES